LNEGEPMIVFAFFADLPSERASHSPHFDFVRSI
jgi:hypothetical protein